MVNSIKINEAELGEDVWAVFKCPRCHIVSKCPISWDEDYYNQPEDLKGGRLHICSCVSAGVYKVYFECPNCNQEMEI